MSIKWSTIFFSLISLCTLFSQISNTSLGDKKIFIISSQSKNQNQHIGLDWDFWPDDLFTKFASLNRYNESVEIIHLSIFVNIAGRLLNEFTRRKNTFIEVWELFGANQKLFNEIFFERERVEIIQKYLCTLKKELQMIFGGIEHKELRYFQIRKPAIDVSKVLSKYNRHLLSPIEIFLMTVYFRPTNDLYDKNEQCNEDTSKQPKNNNSSCDLNTVIDKGRYLNLKMDAYSFEEQQFAKKMSELHTDEEYLLKMKFQELFKSMKAIREDVGMAGIPLQPGMNFQSFSESRNCNFCSDDDKYARLWGMLIASVLFVTFVFTNFFWNHSNDKMKKALISMNSLEECEGMSQSECLVAFQDFHDMSDWSLDDLTTTSDESC